MGIKNAQTTVPDLISPLKSAFQDSCFSEVEEILVSREAKMKQEIETLKQEKNLAELKFQGERLDKIDIKRSYSKLQEEVSLLKEEKLKSIKLINELNTKNCELVCDKLRAENQVEVITRKFDELEARVSILEKDMEILMKAEPAMQQNVNNIRTEANEIHVAVADVKIEKGDESDHLEIKKDSSFHGTGSERSLSKNIVEISDSDNDDSPHNVSNARARASPKDLEDEAPRVLKRKRDSSIDTGENDIRDTDNAELLTVPNKSPVKHGSAASMSLGTSNVGKEFTPVKIATLPQSKEKVGTSICLNSSMSESSSSSSDSDDDVDLSVVLPIKFFQPGFANRDHNRWESQANMLIAFERDEELCMKAVCALYRQQNSVNIFMSSSSASPNKGFKSSATIRGTTLAKFLMDGDPAGKLKKSKEELIAFDKKGLDDCKKLAIEHSSQLFEIYQKHEDPLFLN
ncbi:uncharacterized protein LOC126676150 [Mercurialis annua]|uniref:uncharacterized protein LOC126676150 n=1 Tax=Mercurialis annua TaxID=3986 RepID=UPI00215E0BCF|nr:uncharacterized protein LOC126676150 [Mercurialis annua]